MQLLLLQKKHLTRISFIVAVILSGFSSPLLADSLWQLVSQADYQEELSSIQIPGALAKHQSLKISRAVFDGMAIGSTVTINLAATVSYDYVIIARHDYLNGDIGWDALLDDGDKRYVLTLTQARNVVLATVFSPTGKARLKAFPFPSDASSYLGWLYTTGSDARAQAIDSGGVIPGGTISNSDTRQQFAITGSDVSINQSISNDRAAIGDRVDIDIELTNNLASTLTNEALTVLFILDEADFLTSSGSCEQQTLDNFIDMPSVLSCSLPDIASGATHTISYSIRTTNKSYPILDSAVFVGDIQGDNVRNDEFIVVIQDTLTDTDGDGISNYNEGILATDPFNSNSVIPDTDIPVVDLMFYYTQRFADDIGSSIPESEINQLVQVTNNTYAISGAQVIFRPVFYQASNYDVAGDLNQAFNNLQNAVAPAFADVPADRSAVGADIVVLIDGLLPGGDLCGLGTIPGAGLDGELTHPNFPPLQPYITLFMAGSTGVGNSFCDEDTLAHELGHNFGLNHSRREEDAQGTYAWSLGHGVDGSFTTVMANPNDFPGSSALPLFSNSASTDCNVQACGISRNDLEQGADAVHSLNQTRFQIAAINTSNILDTATLSSAGANAIFFGGASRSGQEEFLSTFTSAEAIDARVTIDIPSEHIGQTGITHIVALAEGVGFFQLNQQGSYVSWDGAVETLESNIAPRPLNASEQITAFVGLVAAAEGFEAINLTIYFAYSIPGTDVFAYTANGLPINIVAP